MTLALKKTIPETNSKKKKLSLFIAGIGAVGGTLLGQVRGLNHPLFELDIKFKKWMVQSSDLSQ